MFGGGGGPGGARALRDYLAAVAGAASGNDGATLAALFALDKARTPLPPALGVSGAAVVAAAADAVAARRLPDAVGAVLSPSAEATRGWHAVLVGHLTAAAAWAAGDLDAAFNGNHDALTQFLNILKVNTNWVVPPLHVLARDTMAALRALEGSLARRGMREGAPEKLQSMVTTLRNAFSFTYGHKLPSDQLPLSRKWGTLAIVNLLLANYFRTDQLRQGKFFITGVENPAFPPIDAFPKAQAVTYRYYTGVLATYQDEYGRALNFLQAALRACHAGYAGNIRRILLTLVPVSLYTCGRVPPARLLAKYGLDGLYGPIVAAFRSGNVAQFHAAMAANRDAYIRAGVYLTLERLTLLIQRTLLRKVCNALIAQTGSVQLRLAHIAAGMRVGCGLPADGSPPPPGSAAALAGDAYGFTGDESEACLSLDEVECIIATLIARKMVRGYLSHKPPVLVLAKSGAFRPLPEVLAATAPGGGAGAAAGGGGGGDA